MMVGWLLAPLVCEVLGAVPAGAIDYNRDIRPIFSENCYACHGPDQNKRKAGLRLDVKEEALKKLAGGGFAIAPGKAARSDVFKRVATKNPDDIMPPLETGKHLSKAQIDLLRRWIDQGAKWSGHWAYVKPERPPVPVVKDKKWARNEIDIFILARLEKAGLKPSAEADRVTLIRRLTLDLTGLPPTLAEVDAFVADTSSNAYEKLVDRLLAAPQFGERMAQQWLDLARYADTHGYHADTHRSMWRWREWVIQAFNDNKPFDQFTVEQLAGDLLPNTTLAQRIASGFNRNNMVTDEGGADPDEYFTKYIIDRVTTTATVWLGTTFGCAECHDHKYDPFTQKEFYQFYAFFNNVNEVGMPSRADNAVPYIKFPTPEEKAKQDEYARKIPESEKRIKDLEAALPAAQAKWEVDALSKVSQSTAGEGLLARFEFEGTTTDTAGKLGAGTFQGAPAPVWAEGKSGKGLQLDGRGGHVDLGNVGDFERTNVFAISAWIKVADKGGTVISKMEDGSSTNAYRGFDLLAFDGKIAVHLINKWPENALKVSTKETIPTNTWQHVLVTYDGSSKAAGLKIYVNAKLRAVDVEKDALSATIRTPLSLHIGQRRSDLGFNGVIDDLRVYNRVLDPLEVDFIASGPVLTVLNTPADKRSDAQKNELKQFYRDNYTAELIALQKEPARLRAESDALNLRIDSTMVMEELPSPRKTQILMRGDFRARGDVVTAAVPKSLPPLPEGQPANRLALAKWLVSPEHPTTSRVTLNRYWQMFFGTGIVKTTNDFGSQGEWPSHPELLDWLATEFMARKWDVKAMVKMMAMSATYRQSTVVSRKVLESDPYNRLYARGPRFRLDAEVIRDNALAIGGLLNRKIGGPSVFPYQPPGLWEEVAGVSYTPSKGADLYRRGIYTYWKRSRPYPSLITFDAPNREVCTAERPRTSTPLQALVALNDPAYVEAARGLAQRVLKEGGTELNQRLTYAFRLTLARAPKPKELEIMAKVYQQELKRYQQDKTAAAALLTVGESPVPAGLDPSEMAAWTAVGNMLLNLDETLTKG